MFVPSKLPRSIGIKRSMSFVPSPKVAAKTSRLYTGNDDNIVLDLITPYRFGVGEKQVERRVVGGLLGHWSVWTSKAVKLLQNCHQLVGARRGEVPLDMLRLNLAVTDCNAVLFDAANGFFRLHSQVFTKFCVGKDCSKAIGA